MNFLNYFLDDDDELMKSLSLYPKAKPKVYLNGHGTTAASTSIVTNGLNGTNGINGHSSTDETEK